MIKNTVLAALVIFLQSFSIQPQTIPRLYFQGDIAAMETKEDARDIAVTYVDGDVTFTGYAELKIQGSSSLAYDKKNYNIKLFSDEAHDDKLKVDLGWGAENKYCLKANWIDRTQSRNVVTANLTAQCQRQYDVLPQAPNNGSIDGFPVEIYINGEFLGLYTLNIPKDDWAFAMDDDEENHIVLQSEGWEAANKFLAMPDFESWAVEVGGESGETLEKMQRLFDFVLNSTDEEFRAHAGEYLDLDAALNYYVLADFACLADNVGKNMLLATYDGQVWYPLLYDLDTSWGTTSSGALREPDSRTITMSNNGLFRRLEECFPRELGRRYFELRLTILNEAHIMEEFETFYRSIPAISFAKEQNRWGEDIPGYDLEQIREFLKERIPGLDEKYREFALGE